MGKPISYNDVKIVDKDTIKFGDKVLDNFLSTNGGVERGIMIALSGTSGAGKTTLCKKLQRDFGNESLFFALESLKSSVARQTKRIKTGSKEKIADEKDFPTWSSFMNHLRSEKPTLVIVDSLQHAAKLLSKENGKHKYANYEYIIKDLYTWKDETQGVVILIVQLNGDGKVEGPAATVFDVDCPINLVANPKTKERYMVTEKNRMGPVGKIFYDFVNNDKCIEFFTEDQWELNKINLSLPEFINKSIEAYVAAVSNNENYPNFRKKLVSGYNKIYAEGTSDIDITVKTLLLIQELSEMLK
jgi:predicted ATP-dependent serine protease